MPEDDGGRAQPVWWARLERRLPGGGHRGEGALGDRAVDDRERRRCGDSGEDGENARADAAPRDRTRWAQDLGDMSRPATKLAPRATRAVADEGEGRDLGADGGARPTVMVPAREGEGDRGEVEEATRRNRGGDDE
jgi:hypothetical protein